MSQSFAFGIYEKLPVALQNVACTLAGFQMRRARYNRTFKKALRFLNESQWWSMAEQREYQTERKQLRKENAKLSLRLEKAERELAELRRQAEQSVPSRP